MQSARLRCLVGVVNASERQADQETADERLFVGLYAGLRRFAAVVGPIEVEPDDLVQEALARALSRGPLSCLREPGPYLRTTIVRLAANQRRSFGRGRRAGALSSRRPELRQEVYPSDLELLNELAPEDRAVVYLAVVEGATGEEIGQILGWTAARVRMRKHRALKRLRHVVEVSDV